MRVEVTGIENCAIVNYVHESIYEMRGTTRVMKNLKDMLLGLAIILAVIVFHLFITNGLWTDLIAVVGLIFVLAGYFGKED